MDKSLFQLSVFFVSRNIVRLEMFPFGLQELPPSTITAASSSSSQSTTVSNLLAALAKELPNLNFQNLLQLAGAATVDKLPSLSSSPSDAAAIAPQSVPPIAQAAPNELPDATVPPAKRPKKNSPSPSEDMVIDSQQDTLPGFPPILAQPVSSIPSVQPQATSTHDSARTATLSIFAQSTTTDDAILALSKHTEAMLPPNPAAVGQNSHVHPVMAAALPLPASALPPRAQPPPAALLPPAAAVEQNIHSHPVTNAAHAAPATALPPRAASAPSLATASTPPAAPATSSGSVNSEMALQLSTLLKAIQGLVAQLPGSAGTGTEASHLQTDSDAKVAGQSGSGTMAAESLANADSRGATKVDLSDVHVS